MRRLWLTKYILLTVLTVIGVGWELLAGSLPLFAQEKEAGQSREVVSTCISCHIEIDEKNKEIVEQYKRSAMFTHGIDCSSCHGGDPKDSTISAMSHEKGFKGVPQRKDIPELCASCHADSKKMLSYGSRIRTDQLELYKQSQHGIALFERGDTKVAVCSDCHNAHEVLAPKNPQSTVAKKNVPDTCAKCHSNATLMGKYGINPQVVDDYKSGYHAYLVYNQDQLAAPVCTDCHGSHSATPPGIKTIHEVCSYCHSATVKYFDQSAHSKVFPQLGIKNCLSCHNQHRLERPTDDYFNPEAEFACGRCHSLGTIESKSILAIGENVKRIAKLKDEALSLINETEKVTHLSMQEMKPKIDDIHTRLLSARAKQHSLKVEAVADERAQAEEIYGEVQKFAGRLVERAKKVKVIVVVLAIFLVAYGVFLLIYRKVVLDRIYPWQKYEG